MGDDRLQPAPTKNATNEYETGAATITLHDDLSLRRMDKNEPLHTLEAFMRADRKLRIATERWRRSRRAYVRLEDAFIDLRIALESLYLKDSVNERSQEMRFRLTVFGAWQLAENFDERRSIRKTLSAAYDMASKAVHPKEVLCDAQAGLSDAQKICRRGKLKLLCDGSPPVWGNLVLGGYIDGIAAKSPLHLKQRSVQPNLGSLRRLRSVGGQRPFVCQRTWKLPVHKRVVPGVAARMAL